MPRKKYQIGIALMVASVLTLAMLFAGHRSSDAPVASSTGPAIGADGLPEVVITAPRIKPETVALAERNADAAAGSTPPRSRHR